MAERSACGGGIGVADRFLAYAVTGLGHAPSPAYARACGRELARRSGYTLPQEGKVRITQASDGRDCYRVEIPVIL